MQRNKMSRIARWEQLNQRLYEEKKRNRSGMKILRDRKLAGYWRSWAQVSKLLQTLARSCLSRRRSTKYGVLSQVQYTAFVNHQRAQIGFEPINFRLRRL